MISVVIPTLNAERTLAATLAPLVPASMVGLVTQVIVSDGGSEDLTRTIAEETGADVLVGPKGRGAQLKAGAAIARAPFLLFLHADTVLAPGWQDEVAAFVRSTRATTQAAAFRFALDATEPMARIVETWVRIRTDWLSMPYGDQGLLIARALYDEIGGYREFPLMEDVDIVRRLGGARLHAFRAEALTSAERYRRSGYLRRGARNLVLLTRFLLGASPHDLARAYE